MKYYDIATMPKIDGALSRRLGYSRIFTASEITVAERPANKGRYLLRSSESGMIFKALRDNNCLGIVFRDNLLVKKTLEQAVSNDKLVIIPAGEITCASGPAVMRNTYRLRSVFAYSGVVGAKTAMASLAGSYSALLSVRQMLELAKFIGANHEKAKEMVKLVGEAYDT